MSALTQMLMVAPPWRPQLGTDFPVGAAPAHPVRLRISLPHRLLVPIVVMMVALSGILAASAIRPATAEAADVRDCAGIIAAISGTIPGWAAAAVFAPYCGAWLGEQSARYICWASHQWWGWGARLRIYTATWGRYTRC